MAKVVFVTARFPHPLDKGDKLRAFNQIKQLSRRHEVHLFSLSERPPSDADMSALRPFCSSVTDRTVPRWRRLLGLPGALIDGLPFQVRYFRSADAAQDLRTLITRVRPDVVHVHLMRMAPYVRAGDAPRMTLDLMDCFSIGAGREASWAHGPRRALLRAEQRRAARYERVSTALFDAACIISAEDRAHMPIPDPERLALVPNGVDTGLFHPLAREKRYDLLFTGHMGYPPNIAAATFTAREVLPRLHELDPGRRLLIAGIGATRTVHALRSDRIDVIEHFDHIREAFAMSRVLVAPMRISIGLQNKILQAMAMGIPVVTTTQGNAAIGGVHGEHVLVADDPRAIAALAHRLLTNEDLTQHLTRNALAFVTERFTWERANEELERMMFPPTAP